MTTRKRLLGAGIAGILLLVAAAQASAQDTPPRESMLGLFWRDAWMNILSTPS